MKGRIWLLIGVAVGIAIAVGRLPYFAGAASTLADNAQRIVGSGGHAIVRSVAKHGAVRRIVVGLAAFVGVLIPGATALLLVLTARLTLRLRILVGLLVLILGIAGYHYLGHGAATGTLLLAICAAAIAVVATGPLIAAPLAALAALIGAEYLPRLVTGGKSVSHSSVVSIYRALYATGGVPRWFEVIVLVFAAVPFAFAARLVWR